MKTATLIWHHKFKLAVAAVLSVYIVQFAFFPLPRANAAATATI